MSAWRFVPVHDRGGVNLGSEEGLDGGGDTTIPVPEMRTAMRRGVSLRVSVVMIVWGSQDGRGRSSCSLCDNSSGT